jgi:DNA-directed RNA polymerase subunit alpha
VPTVYWLVASEKLAMAQGLESDVHRMVLSNVTFGPHEIQHLVDSVADDYSNYRVFRDAVSELESQEERTPAMAVRLGVCYYLLGCNSAAANTLQSSDGGALAHFYLGKCHMLQEHYSSALEEYELAASAGYDSDKCALARVEAHRCVGNAQEALATLDALSGPVEQTAEYLYQRGATVAALGANPDEVIALYERAVAVDGNHIGALFGLALENERRGNDHTALELYQRAASRFPTNLGTLLNLGLLYEDMQQYDRARQCYQRILDVYPSHERARLFLKDADASRDMFYDEEAQRKRDRLTQVLGIPVTDFELSVRSRNCLQKMGIEDLGDLTRTTEQELLASKNFGETSLVEIREMLASKGLELGQFAHERREEEPPYDPESLSPDEKALLDRPIADLNLSVRARKCMVRLGLTTIGELVRRTGDDLLECKNFGVTSLNEVREKLVLQGLKLRGD